MSLQKQPSNVLNDEATHLRLDGHGFQFASIKFNGEDFKHYHQDHESLTLDLTNQSAVNFELEIVTNLEPAQNTSLQGLLSIWRGAFVHNVKQKVSVQITYMLDRPDVLARYTTKITADKTKYPYLLSNGKPHCKW